MRNFRLTNVTALCGLLLAGAVQAAPEFNVDVKSAGNGRSEVALSYISEGDVAALDFTVQLDVTGQFHADLQRCLASLPKTHTGVCRVQGDTLRGIIYSRDNTPLVDTNIGQVVVEPGSMLKAGAGPDDMAVRGVDVTAVSPAGRNVSTSVRINGQATPNR